MGWKTETGISAQNLLGAVKALTEAGFAVVKADAVNAVYLTIQCAYLGKPESPKSLSMDGVSDAFKG